MNGENGKMEASGHSTEVAESGGGVGDSPETEGWMGWERERERRASARHSVGGTPS